MWSIGDRVWRLSIPWRPLGVEATPAAQTSSDVSREAGGRCSHSERLPHELVTGKGGSRRPKPEVYSAAGDVSPQAGDREGPGSVHPLLGPRRWSPGRASPKAEGTYPVSCHPGGWSATWVRGYRGGGARGGLNGECRGPSHRAPRWVPDVRKCRGKKEPPLRTVDEGLYWAVALGKNSWGRVSEETKRVCEV